MRKVTYNKTCKSSAFSELEKELSLCVINLHKAVKTIMQNISS
ncbi:15459_t:CDS:2 [Funneliformis mosseae]|uniref:15459_t:CDS:1 n=1 Tax=Funneliformis mosseae TaxID=27381 RepID=A0A9N9GW49_FUNMO|nr:15459_t:CDS:2 [Funneliformis mosseae]